MYVSAGNIYIFDNRHERTSGRWFWQNYTIVVKINLNNLKYSSSARIEGIVQDSYWADEYRNDLRVVSWVSGWSSATGEAYTRVTILNNNLRIIGEITNIAPRETVFSVRFNRTMGTIVTMEVIDPVFLLDLSNPRNPTISDGLKEYGVSMYLQYLSDNMVLGLGREGTPAGWLFGIKMSLYDTSGVEAVNLNTIVLGDQDGWTWSEALWNPRAILNDPANNLFAFPMTMWQGNGRTNGLAVFRYNLNAPRDEDKLIFQGMLSNIEGPGVYDTWQDMYYNSYSYINRGARIGNRIFTISDRYITSYDVNSLALVQRLKIATFTRP